MFGVYFHIPHCVQLCSYCDFARYQVGRIPPPEDYFEMLRVEIQRKAPFFRGRAVDTIYFGGGTPSLVPPHLILALLQELEKEGLSIRTDAEVTLEADPNAISREKMKAFGEAGVNRFSFGVQSFDDRLLQLTGRRHSSAQARQTLEWAVELGSSFSLDILFALPGQTIRGLEIDLDTALEFNPGHLSPYCLTVSGQHKLAAGRPSDDIQREMFFMIEAALGDVGLKRYEVSNYAKPGFESRHNLLYWNESNYWGIGLSAHSYENGNNWGTRYWNPSGWSLYQQYIHDLSHRSRELTPWEGLPQDQFEHLQVHQALTDFCHVRLRKTEGFSEAEMSGRFRNELPWGLVKKRLINLKTRGLVTESDKGRWSLTSEGWVLSNLVFEELTFLNDEVKRSNE